MRATSKEAYAKSEEAGRRHRAIILNTMRRIGRPEIAERIAIEAGLEYNQVSRRLKEIEDRGLIRCTSRKALTSKGRNAFEWELVTKRRGRKRVRDKLIQ